MLCWCYRQRRGIIKKGSLAHSRFNYYVTSIINNIVLSGLRIKSIAYSSYRINTLSLTFL